jgi:ADP-dependent NAD(P)H-hydrate dehydratase / NAD(P)H-hydrate epimerase
MTELLTAAQMRAIEAAAIASGQVTGLDLMERAGAGVVEAVFAEWPALRATSHCAVVLCGPGNNGGDGFVVARLLKEWGWEVEVFLYGDPAKLPPDARVNYERWVGMGEVKPLTECYSDRWWAHPLVVDAVFGIGLNRPVPEEFKNVLMATLNCRRVAIDFPSIIASDSGNLMTEWPSHKAMSAANLTVTFHKAKLGHFLGDGSVQCGKVVIKDIGLRSPGLERSRQILSRLATPWTGGLAKGGSTHKFSHGHALILSGPSGHGGAARMAARGALRIGAGLVTLACPSEALPENAGRLDAIMLKPVADGAGLTDLISDPRITALCLCLCLGPGLGLDARAADLVRAALVGRATARLPLTLDADALTLIARDPALFALLQEHCVLTPHHGEFARLFPDIAAKLDAPATTGPAYSKVDATRDAAARAGCTVLYKGPDTVIASPDGTCAINSAHYDRAAPWLATAGSGDVLAGFITGLLARGFAPQQAAETAAWLHVECARSFGPGLIAEDLPEELPKVFRALDL